MTKAWRLFVLAVGVCALGGHAVLAAEPSPVAATEAVQAQPNPEAGTEPVQLGLSLRGDYTDNRDATESDKESTFDFYVTPRIDVFADTDRSTLAFFYEPSLRYRENPSDIQNDVELLHNLGVNAYHAMSDQTKLRLLELFNYQDDPSIDSDGSPVRDNRTYYLNRLEAGVRHDFSTLTSGDVFGRYTLKRYEDDEASEESDEDRVEGHGLLRRQLSRNMAIRAGGGISLYGYDSAVGIDRDFDVLLGSLGLDKAFSPQVRGGLDVGAQAVEYSDDTIDSEVFPYARADITISPTPAFRLRGVLGHGVRESDVYPFASQEYTEFNGGAEVDASKIVTLGLNTTYRVSTYDETERPAGAPAPLPGASDSGDETTTVVSGNVAWALRDAARLLARQTYEDVDSDVEDSYQKNTTSVELHLDF